MRRDGPAAGEAAHLEQARQVLDGEEADEPSAGDHDAPSGLALHQLDGRRDGAWRPVAKRSPDKATLPGAKQVFRHVAGGVMREDVLAVADERLLGRPLLEPVMRDGRSELRDPLRVLRARAATELRALPPATPYPVMLSDRLARLTAEVQGVATAQLRLPLAQHGRT